MFLDEYADYDIMPAQYAALIAIQGRPGIDATRLSALITFDRSAIGNVIERLEARGLATRQAGTKDRRQKLLSLSDASEQFLLAVPPLPSGLFRVVLSKAWIN